MQYRRQILAELRRQPVSQSVRSPRGDLDRHETLVNAPVGRAAKQAAGHGVMLAAFVAIHHGRLGTAPWPGSLAVRGDKLRR